MPFTITSYRARRHYIHLAAKIDRTSRSKKERKGKKIYIGHVNCSISTDNSIRTREQALFFFGLGYYANTRALCENYVYCSARSNDIVQRRVKISVSAEKSYDTYIFFHATPFNTLISPGAVFLNTCSRDLIMQMYEVKRPGPSYDRSETTPARSCGCSLYHERSG